MHYSEPCVRKQKAFMKKYIKAVVCSFLLLIANVSFFYASPSSTDAYEDLFNYAVRLRQGGVPEQAELEFKRYIFMQDYSSGIHQTQAFENLAELYALDNRWELAADNINKAILSSINSGETENQTDELRLKHIFYLEQIANQNKTKLSENISVFSYMNLPDFSDKVRQTAVKASLENLVHLELWQTASNEFDLAVQNEPKLFDEYEAEVIRANLDAIIAFKPKKQLLAGYLSFIPGLGQLYAGDYKDSLNAFLLNGSIIAVSTLSIISLDFWTFSLLEFNPLIHFMRGNIYNAQRDVYEYNKRKIEENSKEILEFL